MTDALSTVLAVAVALIAVAVVVAVVALLPLIRQARQTLSRADGLIASAEQDVRRTVAELREAIQNLNQISAGVLKNMDKVSRTTEAIQDFGETLRGTSDILRTTVQPRLLSFGAMIVGLRMGGRFLLRKIFAKRR
ncbi:MAG TPA: DUF948 domain-containing protein [Candidatus Methylomirabilis sp.]|jgi:uncharacterized protein YoxC|nr:DUF948 domain-containing protein [Candidatus Methylomirabilis sp.]